jgi:hypothetical protein
MLDEQMQDPNLAALKALLDAALDFFGDEMASLGSRGEGTAAEVSGICKGVQGSYKVFCQGIVYFQYMGEQRSESGRDEEGELEF